MLYKQFVYTPVILIITVLKLAAPSQDPHDGGIPEKHGQAFRPIDGGQNGTAEDSLRGELPEEEVVGRSSFAQGFPSEVYQCIEDHQNLITANVNLGKSVILKCFKTTLMLNMLRTLGESSQSKIKLFNGLLEFEKIPGKVENSSACGEENCKESRNRHFETYQSKKEEYVRLYKKAMLKLINERKRLNAFRNRTEEEKADQLNRINANSQAFLSEVIRNIGDEEMERAEEEKLKKEMTDPRLLSLVDALSKEYMLRFRFYPGVSARMMRSNNGGFSFDLEVQDSEPELETEAEGEGDMEAETEGEVEGEAEAEAETDTETETEASSDESLTREIKEGSLAQDYFYYEDDEDRSSNRSGKGKGKGRGKNKKKKVLKKAAKKLKKILPYLLLPMLIQVALLPLVLKKLFFLAMKALLAGKVALILVTFNLLRNSCIHNDDDFQKIRVEHYGYGRGEEYGAWINGRALPGPSMMEALSREPYLGQRPVSQ